MRSRPYRRRGNPTSDISDDPHTPMLACWALKLALSMGWHRKPNSHQLPDLLEDEYFQKLTGIELPMIIDDDGDLVIDHKKTKKLTDAKITAQFQAQLSALGKEFVEAELPLVRNVALLGRILGMSDVDKKILQLAVAIKSFSAFHAIIDKDLEGSNMHQLARNLGFVFDLPPHLVIDALKADSLLRASGIIEYEAELVRLGNMLDVINGLAPLLVNPDLTEDALINLFLRPAGAGTLELEAFPHLASDIEILSAYLVAAQAGRAAGINVLFYGVPGTGKTELVKALAHKLGMHLYEISYADDDGDPIKGSERLRAYNLCQRITAQMPDTLLMFDEIEDVLEPDMGGFLMSLFGGGGVSRSSGKAWINRTLERNPVPAIWITNNPQIDPAYLRRFDYSVRFSIPPQSVRLAIAKRHFGDLAPCDDWLARIAANEETTPAQLERASRVARMIAPGDPARAMAISEQTLDRSATLLDQKRRPARNPLHTGYDLRYVNTDIAVTSLIAGLRLRPRGSFCFYGPAGTGKSELGRYMADAIDKPVLLRRASDILSMWVGEAEKNIARMFADARQRDAVLILDEADSFLADRRDAHASWEVTQVNELLTQMEAFEGIFICTTNLMQKLDQASLRRFAFKVKFDYLKPEQRESMFLQELERLGGNALDMSSWCEQVRKLSQLTPGDFSVAARQFELWGGAPTAGEFFTQLKKECIAKGAPARGIGFTV